MLLLWGLKDCIDNERLKPKISVFMTYPPSATRLHSFESHFEFSVTLFTKKKPNLFK